MRNVSVFRSVNLTTIIAVYLLILIGGVVRSLGAGMGCPDWPKCFGQYAPPTSVAELPDNYQAAFTEKRLQKNDRLANVLSSLGFSSLANEIRNKPEIMSQTTFSVSKAWIEYINRLVGVLIGLLIMLNAWFSLKLKEKSIWIPILGVFAFLLVVFQGWVGSLVVATNLLPGFITFHMILALLLVSILLIQQSQVRTKTTIDSGSWFMLLFLVVLFVQIILGTGVREDIDQLTHQGIVRESWINSLGMQFYIHRSFSILILILTLVLFWMNRKSFFKNRVMLIFMTVVILEILVGIILAYFDVPSFAQPAHLLLGSIGFGMIFYLFLDTYPGRRLT